MNEEFSPIQEEDTVPTESFAKQKKGEKSFLRELVDFTVIIFLIVVPFRMYIAQPFVVNGASMDPTFENGEYLIVDQLSYRFEKPLRGSILIFKYPNDTSKYFIKRIIGLPGETVVSNDGIISIVNRENPQGISLDEPYVKFLKKDSFQAKLGNDEYFVMGDNRIGSADSRMWGALPKKDIVGRPVLRLFPVGRTNVLPGDFKLPPQ